MRSPVRRVCALVILVAAAASITAIQLSDVLEAVDRTHPSGLIFARQLAQWGVWGLLAVPIMAISLASLERFRSSGWVLLLQIVLGTVTSAGVTLAHEQIDAWLFEGGSPMSRPGGERGERGERGVSRAPDGSERSDEDRRPPRRSRSRGGRGELWTSPRLARNLLVYSTIVGIGLALAATVRAREQARRAADLELTAARLEVELGTARMTALQHQLRPHFLFNALHAVGGLVRQGRDAEVQDVLSGLGALLRTSLHSDDKKTSTLAAELDLVRHYLDVEAIRLGERLRVDVAQVEPAIGATPVPALLLLPVIENAVQHGVAPREEGGAVTLTVERDGEAVEIVVRDDGPGFPDDVLAGATRAASSGRGSGASIGLANTRARLGLFGNSTMTLANDHGAVVTIRLPAAGTSA